MHLNMTQSRESEKELANDPAQRMLPIHARHESRSGKEAVAEEKRNIWLGHAGTEFRLMQTMRHGSAIIELLRATWPQTYQDLSPAPEAPNSSVRPRAVASNWGRW